MREIIVRAYRSSDVAALRQCVIELQEFERTIDPRLRAGAVVGFVAVLAAERFTELDDPPGAYALITDLAVLSSHRQRGIGRRLLERAEDFARRAGATELRIGVLEKNSVARRLYLATQFAPHLEVFAKRL